MNRAPGTAILFIAIVLCHAHRASAQEQGARSIWTYRATFVDEVTTARTNPASPFSDPRWSASWIASNQLVAGADGSWAPNERIKAGGAAAIVGRAGEAVRLRVRESYVRASVSSWLDVEGGKRLVRWGTGYAFTPTGLLDPPRDAADPQDRLGLNEGMAMAQAVLFRGETALTVAAAAPRAWRSSSAAPERLVAAKLRTAVRGFELALVGSVADGRRVSAGGNFTHVVGQQLEWHGEVLVARGVSALIGFQYTFEAGMNVVVEYYRDAGTFAIGRNRPAPRDFVFVRAARASTTAGWLPEISTIVGVDDGGVTIVPSIVRTLGSHLQLQARGVTLAGPRASAARQAPVRATISAGLSLRF